MDEDRGVGERTADQLIAAPSSRSRRRYGLVSTRWHVKSNPEEALYGTAQSYRVAPVCGVMPGVMKPCEHSSKD